MQCSEFRRLRRRLNKTQQQVSHLLGVSVRAVHSYEQGWRPIPVHAQRQLIFLLSRKVTVAESQPCWIRVNCPESRRRLCPAWEFNVGELCWFISGTICTGHVQSDWDEKMKKCRQCVILRTLLEL